MMTFLLTVVWPLLRRYWGVVLALVFAGWLMLACHQRDTAIEQRGRAIERAMQLDRQLASLATKHRADSVRADSLATVVRVDTVRLAKWLTRWDTVTATVNVHDTVAVKGALADADSTIRSCKQTVLDLLSSCQAKDTVIADQRQIIATLRSATPIPPKDRRFSLGITAGYGATAFRDRSVPNDSTRARTTSWRVITGPSVTVGGSLRLY